MHCRDLRQEAKKVSVESREVHIKHVLDTGAVKDRNNEDAIKTGAKILSRRSVDDAHKEKSRWCATEFATHKDSSVFAAAPDVDNTSLIDLLAVKRGHSIMCFDAVAAFSQAPETELIFIQAPAEHRAKIGQLINVAMPEVREGTRKGARAWQDHFVDIFEGVSGNIEAESEVPSNLSFERVRDRIGLARRRHLRDRTTRKHEEGVRRSRDQNCVEILTHHQRRKLVRACWNYEGHRRRRHVGERTGQVRIVRAVDDEDERMPSIDGSQARETA